MADPLAGSYLADPDPAPIRMFDDMLKLCLGAAGRKEGQGEDCYGILVIETDGEMRKNDTLRASFGEADRFERPRRVTDTSLAEVLSSPEYLAYARMQRPTAARCQSCTLLPVCGGGMPLYRWSAERGYDNPSAYCSDHTVLIRHAIARMRALGLADSLAASPALAGVS